MRFFNEAHQQYWKLRRGGCRLRGADSTQANRRRNSTGFSGHHDWKLSEQSQAQTEKPLEESRAGQA